MVEVRRASDISVEGLLVLCLDSREFCILFLM